eukprot:207438-Rhodomonas_salina.1
MERGREGEKGQGPGPCRRGPSARGPRPPLCPAAPVRRARALPQYRTVHAPVGSVRANAPVGNVLRCGSTADCTANAPVPCWDFR